MAKIRLDKYLADMQIGTRSAVKEYIRKGRVRVNEAVVKSPEQKIDTETDTVLYDDKPVGYHTYEYFMLNKPQGVVSATQDTKEKTVTELITEKNRKDLFPVGRLDKDTTGLMILTDDGALAHEILAPQKHVPKQYRVTIDIPMTEEMVHRFAEGIELKDGRCQPAELTIESEDTGVVTLREGRYHQIKRMFGCCGAVVTGLHRLSMGALRLDDTLAPGECRPLSEEEISLLRQQHLPE